MPARPAPRAPLISIDLCSDGFVVDGERLPRRLLSRLLAALLQAHAEGLARDTTPCTRAALRDRIVGLPELHRTQLWRALQGLDDSPLRGLVCCAGRSAGPFWLDDALLRRCRITVQGKRLTTASLAAFLGQQRDAADVVPVLSLPPRRTARSTAGSLPSLGYVAALARADLLIDRGELYPARQALQDAQLHLRADDALEAAALSMRRARVARRLGDWAGVQVELRELAVIAQRARLSPAARRQLDARQHLLAAWHLYGSLGNTAAALARLLQVDAAAQAADLHLCSDCCNLRGILLRELALSEADATRAAQAMACLGEAVRSAALAGLPDALQIAAANLANSLSALHEAGLLPQQQAGTAVDWLLLSESVCAQWSIGRSSLLNMVFLLRLAVAHDLDFARVSAAARAQGQTLHARSFAALAADTWTARERVHSQIPVEQRCAFFLMWATHATREQDRVSALELCGRVLREKRKLRDAVARSRYEEEVQRLRAMLTAVPSPAREASTTRKAVRVAKPR
ncbi:hypothetical protein [Uliginosibacterium sp. H1]|uniref:hypothetical protein n=1 Tax=Uliginosibacterium sp. H1 TaxID=3114757 RepID=UPI002E1802E2|nr:hypothetical protein [Uliginosibacterium sp. H1]